MKKEDLFKQWEELKTKEEDIDCIILYIHMPTGEEEVIVNPNVVDKMQYIGKTYNDDLIHANCKDIYITDVIFSVNDDSCMDFEEALALMKEGHKVKLPSWGGYWSWDQEKETVIMHTKDGEDLDIGKHRELATLWRIFFLMNGRLLTRRIVLSLVARLHSLLVLRSNI